MPAKAEASPGTVRWHDLRPILLVGLPIGFAIVAELGVFLAATLYAATLGAADVAAHALRLRVAGVAYAVPAALLQAAAVRMACAEDAADPALRRMVTYASLSLSPGAGSLLFLLIGSFESPLAEIFFDITSAGRAAAGVAARLFFSLGTMHLIVNPGAVAAGLLRGRKDTRIPMIFTLAGYWDAGVPVGIWLCEAADLGITGIWIELFAGMTTATLLMLLRLARPPLHAPRRSPLARLFHWARVRRQRRHLPELNDHLLRDIGLAGQDVAGSGS